MSEELGKIEKPAAEEFKKGRKLYFVPLFYFAKDSPAEYQEKLTSYWEQIEQHISNLEEKLGRISKIFHELIPASGEDGAKVVKDLNDKGYDIVKSRLDKGAHLEATEDGELLTEFMDWGRCLSLGLQNQKVFTRIYESYIEITKKRNEFIARHIDETLNADEAGVLFMREGHQVHFPSDVEIFYVSPPALDELNRWFRDHEAKSH
ncbi:hypothetical protein ACFLXL_02765 [Chloroflexota bacterium]